MAYGEGATVYTYHVDLKGSSLQYWYTTLNRVCTQALNKGEGDTWESKITRCSCQGFASGLRMLNSKMYCLPVHVHVHKS